MPRVRCSICRKHVPTLKSLKNHYISCHTKIQIIKHFIQTTIQNSATKHTKKRRNNVKTTRSLYIKDKVHISYTNDAIIIENDGSDDNLIELTFEDNVQLVQENKDLGMVQKAGLDSHKNRKRRHRKANNRKTFQIGIRKMDSRPLSLDANTGDFYECHCMVEKTERKTPASDTESCSDTGKTFYCNTCSNGYHTKFELTEHEKIHQFMCRICNQIILMENYRQHIERHVLRIYVCHLCGFEFICKEVLRGHLEQHFEQQTLEDVLNMEQDYSSAFFDGSTSGSSRSGDYYAEMNNILFFLTYPYDHYYTNRSGMFMKIVCDVCLQEFYAFELDRHMKMAHLVL